METMRVSKTCPVCSKGSVVEVERDQFEAYLNGALLQEAFPTLGASQREMVKTGIHPSCWENMMFWSGCDD
jgi:hypothetical protein